MATTGVNSFPYAPYPVYVGPSSTKVATVQDQRTDVVCPTSFTSPYYNTAFNVTTNNGNITVQRADQQVGWGERLNIPCALLRGFLLQKKKPRPTDG